MSSLQTHPKPDFCLKEFSFSNLKLQILSVQAFQVEVASFSNLCQDRHTMDHFLLSSSNQTVL